MQLATVLGANAILFVFHVAGSNLRHSHVWISYGALLEHLFISPAQHQIHHSVDRRHHDKNFGAVLAVWDWLGGTLNLASGERDLQFGVGGAEASPHALSTLYLTPFRDALDGLSRALIKRPIKMLTFRPYPVAAKSQARIILALLGAVICLSALAVPAMAKELNIYSHRQPFLIQPFIDAYAVETGTKVNIVYASKGLAQRLQAEGCPHSPTSKRLCSDKNRPPCGPRLWRPR